MQEQAHDYPISSLISPFCYIVTMLCQLVGCGNFNPFYVDWIPIIQRDTKGNNFNWAEIMSNKISQHVMTFQEDKTLTPKPPFYMSSFIMNSICQSTTFRTMG